MSDRSQLLNFLTDHYTLDELQTLCFRLYIPFEDLPSETREGKARELLSYVERHHRLVDLQRQLQRDREAAYLARFGALPAADAPLSTAQAREIQDLAQAIGRELGRDTGRFLYQTAYAALNREFRVRSYRDIPAGRFDEARRFLADWRRALGPGTRQ